MNSYQKAKNWIVEKFNPAQSRISQESGSSIGSDALVTYSQAFTKIESVNRGVNMIVTACASLDYDIKEKVADGIIPGMRQKQLNTLLNFRPNPYQSAQDFRKNIFTDFILEGNAFIYFDGAFIYHLPASRVEIITDEKTFIKGYKYNGITSFGEHEVFSFKDISGDSIYRGSSRLESCAKSVKTLYSMQQFQESFFDNGAVFGMVLTTENTLSRVAKEKTINYWTQKYNPKLGGKRPVILDSGLKPHNIAETNFKDMDFDVSIKTHNEKIMQALGVPPILLAGGNNANISPNLRLFYLETILPIVRGFVSAAERYFGYDVEAITTTVSALQPELKDIASYHSTLVNSGIITPNEARIELRFEKIAGHDELRIPANIAGSAANPSQGGKPPKNKE
jgi:HK97 family phage portal protein